ncbi:putative dwnn domain-containing protein [Erysiphe necator]|uniref:Putative dwnn domain-containing protein n=1 Tax=Uncinula necator TaxID=52586 RepID=A0A0B1NZJ5_UNCNE|nr:putative dwnn domain-containing protein [Erysiphe necator]
MSSSVFYKFKSQKEPSRIEFDGTGISVFELKRDIILKSGLGDGADFDLSIFNDDGTEEYDDDTTVIPRSTTVIAQRLPAAKRGAGRAQRYMTGKMPVNAKMTARKEQVKSMTKTAGINGMSQFNSSMSEEQRLAAMFEASSQQWSGQLEEMAKQTKVYHNGSKKISDSEPPLGYVCYRCGEKGHWIKECPTNDDPSFENKLRIKRTTGIPRSFLRAVEKPMNNSGDGDELKQHSGVMINAEGQFVIAEPDKKSWELFQAKTKSSAAAAEKVAAVGNKEIQDRGLECSIDKRIFIDPMKTPCCEKTYCNDCITNSLIESDFTCPGCQTEGVLLDDLIHDEAMSLEIQQYLEEKNNLVREEREKSNSPIVNSQTTMTMKKDKSKSPSPSVLKPIAVNVNSPSNSSTESKISVTNDSTNNPKKRPAEQSLENPKIPKGPKAMQQQQRKIVSLPVQLPVQITAQVPAQVQQPINTGINGYNSMQFGVPYYGITNMINGYNGMNGMSMMSVVSPMMINGYSGYSNMYSNMHGYNNMGNFNMMNSNSLGIRGSGGLPMSCGNGISAGFPNQQKTIFAEPLPNEEDNAYFRQPVNPHRHQGRQRRTRPQDYREL